MLYLFDYYFNAAIEARPKRIRITNSQATSAQISNCFCCCMLSLKNINNNNKKKTNNQ
jgi:hypothetical protein